MAIQLYPPLKEVRYGTKKVSVEKWADYTRYISQPFGAGKDNPLYTETLKLEGHNGIDIPLFDGTPVYAMNDGIVQFAGRDGTGSWSVELWDDVNLYKTVYYHAQVGGLEVKRGQRIKHGALLGYWDSTGYSTGHHLHFGLKETDKKGATINRYNGYNGAIDPLPFRVDYETEMKLIQKQGENFLWAIIDGKRYWVANPHSHETVGYQVEFGDPYVYPYVSQVAFLNADEPK